MSDIALICGNWGTSSLKAFGVSAYGEIVTDIRTGAGISARSPVAQETLWFETVQDWSHEAPQAAHMLCGMAGSTLGWLETGYIDVPADIDRLSSAIDWRKIDGATIGIVPGVAGKGWASQPERMRGEEVELIGWMTLSPTSEATVCLPGTHTKWAEVSGGAIKAFNTAMTGEVFAALTTATILKPDTGQHFDSDSFEAGARLGLADMGGDTLHRLFAARSQMLAGQIEPAHVEAFLSGLLIARDVAGALDAMEAFNRQLSLIGAGDLTQRFQQVLTFAGIESTAYASEDCVAKGLAALAVAGGVI